MASTNLQDSSSSLSTEYVIVREMLGDLVDLLAENVPVINQLNNHLFSSGLIPNAVHNDVRNTASSPYNRATDMFSSVLAELKRHPNPSNMFTSLVKSLQKVDLVTIADKLSSKLMVFLRT